MTFLWNASRVLHALHAITKYRVAAIVTGKTNPNNERRPAPRSQPIQKRSRCDARAQEAEPEKCKETGATDPVGPMKDGLAKDGCGERQWNVDIRQLVQIGESADQTRQNDRLGIESPVKSKSNQND